MFEIEISVKNKTQKSSRFATVIGLFMCAYEEDYTRTMTDNKKMGIISQLSRFFARLCQQF